MVFASGSFIFVFLPITIIGVAVLKNKPVILRNIFLLCMSMFFYLNSGLKELVLLLVSVTVNYFIARLIARFGEKPGLKKTFFALGICYNVIMLFVFKYFMFVSEQLAKIIPGLDTVLQIALPLGISFYTFQALSYVIDVYRDVSKVEKNIINVALYICLFPQLVAGPIVRWDSIINQLKENDRGGYTRGLTRFTIGLGKKVLIANQMAVFADKAYSLLGTGELTTGFAWLGAIAYTMQIYFDFSGYSDMAIGLGSMLGFDFPENFNYPYISRSITEFWRRWHISLSTWFRDYVYIPLGGNRCSTGRMYFNMGVVWVLTGVWHGANYTFWLWGIIYFVLLAAEKMILEKTASGETREHKFRIGSAIGHIYTMFAVLMLWVLFRADTVSDAFGYYACMFGKTATTAYALGAAKLYWQNAIGLLIVALIGCTPLCKWIMKKIPVSDKAKGIIKQILIVILFIISCCATIDSNYNPFIYFNF